MGSVDAQPLLIAGLGGKFLHVGLVVVAGVFVIAEEVVPTVVELMQKNGEVMHVVLGQQVADAVVGRRVQGLVRGDTIGFDADDHANAPDWLAANAFYQSESRNRDPGCEQRYRDPLHLHVLPSGGMPDFGAISWKLFGEAPCAHLEIDKAELERGGFGRTRKS